jgi:hypothetical protein
MAAVVKKTGAFFKPGPAVLIGQAVKEVFDPLGNDLVAALERDLPGHYKKTVKRKFTRRGINTQMVIFSNAPGIEAIEEGRAPGKQPPPKVLLKWVQRKGLGANAQSVKTRRSLAVGITRTRSRATGKLRTRVQSLLAKQKSIAFLIGRKIGKEGLPRKTGFKPSHRLFLFKNLKSNYASRISKALTDIEIRIAAILNK